MGSNLIPSTNPQVYGLAFNLSRPEFPEKIGWDNPDYKIIYFMSFTDKMVIYRYLWQKRELNSLQHPQLKHLCFFPWLFKLHIFKFYLFFKIYVILTTSMKAFPILPTQCSVIFLWTPMAHCFLSSSFSRGWHSSVDWAQACKPRDCWFDSHSGHKPGLQAGSLVGGCMRRSHILMFLTLSASLSFSLKINE